VFVNLELFNQLSDFAVEEGLSFLELVKKLSYEKRNNISAG
jgi:hypothetical protein